MPRSARQTARLLELNKGKLRSFVGKQLGIRLTPEPGVHRRRDPRDRRPPRGPPQGGQGARRRRWPPPRPAPSTPARPTPTRRTARPTRSPRADEPGAEEPGRARPLSPTPDGILVVDKPQGWTSHDVVARARRLCATRKVGHAGTLDPMATGVLVLGVGRATRLLTFLVGCDKDYAATIRLGQATVTDDAEGEVTSAPGAPGIDRDAVRRGGSRASPATSSRCRARSARSRSRASAPTTACGPASRSSWPRVR